MSTSSSADEVIIRNSARCLKCGDEIVSKHRHDFVTCSCGNLSVDGGNSYLRRVSLPPDFQDTSLFALDESREHLLEHSTVRVGGVHHSKMCEVRPCPLHNRTDHPLRAYPQQWNSAGYIYRTCPHGVDHVDPDETYLRKMCVPDCDGCCGRKEEK